ncbi:hypothetical protein D3C75_860830 [compost metagenome]
MFQHTIVIGSLFEDRHRHGIQADALAVGLRERQIGEGTGDATITIIKRVQGDKPQVADGGAQQWILAGVVQAGIEPVDKADECLLQTLAWRCLEMHSGPIQSPGYHLHRLFTA